MHQFFHCLGTFVRNFVIPTQRSPFFGVFNTKVAKMRPTRTRHAPDTRPTRARHAPDTRPTRARHAPDTRPTHPTEGFCEILPSSGGAQLFHTQTWQVCRNFLTFVQKMVKNLLNLSKCSTTREKTCFRLDCGAVLSKTSFFGKSALKNLKIPISIFSWDRGFFHARWGPRQAGTTF